LGVWVIPCDAARQGLESGFTDMFDGVTYDMRRNGIGILTRRAVPATNVVLAVPDKDGVWRFFQARSAHQVNRPGGWILTGFRAERLIEPESWEMTQFREQIGEQAAETEAPADAW
ncbi:MAG: hypothetical protein KDA85_07205, partial [Planctomycetaceae bacterium]|nr:hypothetical protein [Planctomycetaceae bacterium]